MIDQLSRNKDLCILKQDKWCIVVLMDRTKYRNKSLEILETNQFIKFNHDPTKSVEGKIQRLLKKFKSILSQKEHYQFYLTGSCARKFYGTAKIHKLPPHGNISNLPLRPIISNISTASYQLAKYLTQLLSPLTRSRYTVNTTKDLIVKVKNERFLKTATWYYLM